MVVVRVNKVPILRQYSPGFPVKPCNIYGIAVGRRDRRGHKRPKVAATNPGGLKGLLTHGNTRDAGMAIYPSLEDASFKHLTGPQKVAKRAQRRSSRGSVVSY